jgi:hypothetical protein
MILLLYSIYYYTTNTYDYILCDNNFLFHYDDYNNIKDKVKSGDLILFLAYDHYPISRLFHNLLFQHYGIIIKKDNKLYILECTKDIYINNEVQYNNIFCTDFEDRILKYSGNILISHLKLPLSKSQEDKINKYANACIDNKEEKDKYTYLSNFEVFLQYYYNKEFYKQNKFSCISFIHYIYHNILNIIDSDIKPSHLCKLYHNIILFGNIFKQPYEILHHDLYIKKIYNKNNIIYT